MDASKLTLTLKPAQDSAVIISANADLWTPAAGVNQDLGIWVSGVDQTVYPDGIVAWKESGERRLLAQRRLRPGCHPDDRWHAVYRQLEMEVQ